MRRHPLRIQPPGERDVLLEVFARKAPRTRRRAIVYLQNLGSRLEALNAGAMVILNRPDFETAFADPSSPGAKDLAIEFAEEFDCAIRFINTDAAFAVFTKKQDLRAIRDHRHRQPI